MRQAAGYARISPRRGVEDGRGEGHSVRHARLCEVLDCQPGDLFAFENPAADVAAVAS
jgi:hypothetical protein